MGSSSPHFDQSLLHPVLPPLAQPQHHHQPPHSIDTMGALIYSRESEPVPRHTDSCSSTKPSQICSSPTDLELLGQKMQAIDSIIAEVRKSNSDLDHYSYADFCQDLDVDDVYTRRLLELLVTETISRKHSKQKLL